MKYLILILRILLAITFLFSAYTKAVAPGYFEITLMDQGLAQDRNFAANMTRFFIGLEFAMGVLMIFPFFIKKLMVFTFFLLSAFTIHLIYLTIIGDNENCGCFGEMISMTPEESILKNIVMIAISIFLYKKSSEKTIHFGIPLVLSIVMISSTWVYLPIPDHKNLPFKEFTKFEPIGRVDLSEKNALLAIFNLDCDHCQDAARELSQLKKVNPKFPDLYVLYFKEGTTTVEKFESLTNSKFPYSLIDVNTFFDLIGNSPPRIYHIKKGEVKNIIDDNFSKKIKSIFDLN